MEKIKKCIANLKVEGKLKVYQMTVLVMTLFSVGGTDLDSSDPFKYREDHEGLVSVIGISAGFRDNDCEIQNQTVSASGRIRCSSHELLRRRNHEAGESDPGYRCEAGGNHVCKQQSSKRTG